MEVVAGFVVPHSDIERPMGLDHRHQQALWKGLRAESLLDDLACFDDLEGLLSRDPSLVSAKQRMVPPLDASSPRGSANDVEGKSHTLGVVRGARSAP